MAIGMQEWEERDVVNEGVWHYLADGTCMWTLSIISPGAYSHVVVFRYGSACKGGAVCEQQTAEHVTWIMSILSSSC